MRRGHIQVLIFWARVLPPGMAVDVRGELELARRCAPVAFTAIFYGVKYFCP